MLLDPYGGAINRSRPTRPRSSTATRSASCRCPRLGLGAPPRAAGASLTGSRIPHAIAPYTNGQAYQNYIDPRSPTGSRPTTAPTCRGWARSSAAYDPDDVFRSARASGPPRESPYTRPSNPIPGREARATMSSTAPMITVPPTLAGTCFQAGHADWDEARRPWNVAVDQQPAACARPASVDDVVAVMALAREHGLRVAAQGTGHRGGADGRSARHDPGAHRSHARRGCRSTRRRAGRRAEAGALFQDVVAAAARHGLAALAGSSPDVGVVGYTLGGGMSFLGRAHGLAANSVEAVELVTADGSTCAPTATTNPSSSGRARRGGSFGVVTAIELRLLPVTDVQAGILWWPIERGGDVLHAWRELLAAGVPDAADDDRTVPQASRRSRRSPSRCAERSSWWSRRSTSATRPRPTRCSRRCGARAGDGHGHDDPAAALATLHMDPTTRCPPPATGFLLESLPAEAVDALVETAGADTAFHVLSVEVRHLGGALGRGPAGARRARSARRRVRPLRRRHRADAGAECRGGRRDRGDRPPARAVGGPARVRELRDEPRGAHVLAGRDARPPAPCQGRGRPREPHPREPPDPACRLTQGSRLARCTKPRKT